MPVPPRQPRREKRVAGDTGRPRRRPCRFCEESVDTIDFKDVIALRRATSDRGKIRSRRITGTCRRHQDQVAAAVKRAREMALLPYVDS